MFEFLKPILRGSIASTLMQVISIILSFNLIYLLNKYLGATGFGTYTTLTSTIAIMSTVAVLGFPTLLNREFAKSTVKKDFSQAIGLYKIGLFLGFVILIFLAFLLIIYEPTQLLNLSSNRSVITIVIASSFASMVFIQLNQAVLIGLGHPVLGQVTTMLILPVLLNVIVVLTELTFSIDTEFLFVIYVSANLLSVAINALITYRIFNSYQIGTRSVIKSYKDNLSAMIVFFAISGADKLIARSDFVIIGILLGPTEVALYAVAEKISSVAGIIRQATNKVIQPYLASFAVSESNRQEIIAAFGGLISFSSSFFYLIIVWLLGERLLGYFGNEYDEAYWIMVILTGARVVIGTFGVVTPILSMSGYEIDVAKAKTTSLAVNITLNFLLIPNFGLYGAAFSTFLSIFIWNLWLSLVTIIKMNVNTTIYGVITIILRRLG